MTFCPPGTQRLRSEAGRHRRFDFREPHEAQGARSEEQQLETAAAQRAGCPAFPTRSLPLR